MFCLTFLVITDPLVVKSIEKVRVDFFFHWEPLWRDVATKTNQEQGNTKNAQGFFSSLNLESCIRRSKNQTNEAFINWDWVPH